MRVRVVRVAGILGVLAIAGAAPARAQSLITAVKLGKDQIGLVKTAPGLSTRISFQDTVAEIICGDLYDPTSGRGNFVLQRADKDVFVKPISAKGISNLFVKTGERGEQIYNFDLVVVPPNEALRVVNVIGARDGAGDPDARARARKQAEEIVQQAEAQAASIVASAHRDADALTSEAEDRAQKDQYRRFVNAMMLGVRQEKTGASKISAPNGVTISLDQQVVIFGDKSYLRYTIHNNGAKDFTFTKLSLEDGSGKVLSAEIVQGKTTNVVKPGESLVGVIGFVSDSAGKREKLILSVRGEGAAEIAHLAVSL